MKKREPIWREFSTSEEIRIAVRNVLKGFKLETEFESALISDLIAERHYFCSLKGLRPSKFKKVHVYGEQLQGYFDGIGWHPVSWYRSAGKPPTVRGQISDALRLRIKPLKAPYFQNHRICEYCNSAPSVEIHHEALEWREIMDMIFSEVFASDVDSVMESWDWFNKDEFEIPDGSRIALVFDRIHESAVLKALCKKCHNSTKRRTRA